MNTENFIKFLGNPKEIQQENTRELKLVVDEYPYFQSARALYLKALKDNESFKYNNELKITAAYTANRTVLFDFITSDDFNHTKISSEEKKIEAIKNKTVTNPKKQKSEIKNDLQIGKPLGFKKNETHSFSQWLQLSAKNPIARKKTETVFPSITEPSQENIIDQFIANKPKIPRINKAETPVFQIKKTQKSNELMTETLAKVYLEQKKYDNAIKAYEILSLKYPEKSGFFADQIRRIRILKNSK